MRNLFRILVMALLVSSVVADDSYFPMHVGDEWISATTSSIAGVVSHDSHTKIEGTLEKNGKKYFRLRTWVDGRPSEEAKTVLKRVDENAVYSMDDKQEDAVEKSFIMLPLKLGATWQVNIGKYEATYTVVTLESVKIDDKTYENCYHVRQSIPEHLVMDFWLAPNLGQIKSETVFPTGLKLGSTLKEYKHGK